MKTDKLENSHPRLLISINLSTTYLYLSVDGPTNQSINQSNKINRSDSYLITTDKTKYESWRTLLSTQWTNHSFINWSINQSTNQSINQSSSNQSINQSFLTWWQQIRQNKAALDTSNSSMLKVSKSSMLNTCCKAEKVHSILVQIQIEIQR